MERFSEVIDASSEVIDGSTEVMESPSDRTRLRSCSQGFAPQPVSDSQAAAAEHCTSGNLAAQLLVGQNLRTVADEA